MHGQGEFSWENEDVYRGQFQEGQRTGTGELSWHTGERYRGQFAAGVLQGDGTFNWPDGRTFTGRFQDGVKTGKGVFEWPNGNRYEGLFSADAREGLGVFSARDGTTYRGQFAADKMHGYVVKEQPDGPLEIQQWNGGALQFTRPLAADPRCVLEIGVEAWMFESPDCINGLAHGSGLAVSLDGQQIVIGGRFVLGRLITGDIESLNVEGG
jgi:hypothetical protein